MSAVDTLTEVLVAIKAGAARAVDTIAGSEAGIWYGNMIGAAVDYFSSRPDAIQGVLANIILGIDRTSISMVKKGYMALMGEMQGFVVTALSISLILFALGMLMGWIDYPLKQLGKKLLVWTFLLGLIFNWGFFDLLIYGLFTTAPQALAGIITGSMGAAGDGSIISLLDAVLEKGWLSAGNMLAADGIFIPYVMWALVIFGTTVLCGYVLGLICISKIGLTVVLILGPLFIVASMFELTKHMFQSWLQQAVNYGLITVLTSVIMAFFLQMLSTAIPTIEPGSDLAFSDVASFLLLFVVMMMVLFQVPAVASGLAGGLQLSTLGAFAAGGRLGNNAGSSMGRGIAGAYRGLRNLRRGTTTNTLKGD